MKRKRVGTHASPALNLLEQSGVRFNILTYTSHPGSEEGFARDAARQLGIHPSSLFKTLVTLGPDGQGVLALVPGDSSLSLKKLAHTAGLKRMQMAPPPRAEKLTGYVTGGITPLGCKNRLPVYIDTSAQQLEHMVVSAGLRGVSVELAPSVLQEITNAVFADIQDS